MSALTTAQPVERSGRSLASLYLAVLSLLVVLVDLDISFTSSGFHPHAEASVLFLPVMVCAVWLGHSGWNKIKASGGLVSGKRSALVGMVLGSAALTIAVFALMVPAYLAQPTSGRDKEAKIARLLGKIQASARQYQRKSPQREYPRDLGALPDLGPKEWAKATALGYFLSYTPQADRRGRINGYVVRADPPYGSELAHFYLESGGAVRFQLRGPATRNSPEWREGE